MKILISHSWYDKTIATFIYEKLKEDHHIVWYDIHQLLPGDAIQPKIDKHINECDAVVVVVSKNSAASAGVKAEIDTAKRMKKRLIPLSIDDSNITELQGLLGISFKNREVGMLLLRRALMLLHVPESYREMDWVKNSLENINELGGYINYLDSGRFIKEHEAEDDKDLWIERIQLLDGKNRKLAIEILPKIKSQIETLQKIMQEIEHGATVEELRSSQRWLDENSGQLPPFANDLKKIVEEKLKSPGTANLSQIDSTVNETLVKNSIARLQNAIDERKQGTIAHLTNKLKSNFIVSMLGSKTINSITEAYIDYIETSLKALQTLQKISANTQYVAITQTLKKICDYIEMQDHNAEEQKPYLEGSFDDAYIINNSMKILLKTGLIEASAFQFNFSTMNLVDKYVGFAIPQTTKVKLDAILKEISDMVGLKKNEISWKHVAIAAAGIVVAGAVINEFAGGENGSSGFATFEDNVADFSSRNGLNLDV